MDPDDNNTAGTAARVSHALLTGSHYRCSISVNEDGTVVTNTGLHIPDALNQRTGRPTSDADYLAWGFWVTGSDRYPEATDTRCQ